MSITTVLPLDEDQWRTPVIFGSAANLFSATGLKRVASEPAGSGANNVSLAAGDKTISMGSGGGCSDERAGSTVDATAFLEVAVLPYMAMPHHVPAENSAATMTSASTT